MKVSEKVRTIIRGSNEYEEDEVILEPDKDDEAWIRAWRLGLITSDRSRDYTDSELLDLALTELEEINDALG